MTKKTLLIVGAGYAGLALAKKMASQEDYRVRLIDEKKYHLLKTNLHEVASGRVAPKDITVPIRQVLPQTVDFIQDRILELADQELKGEKASYPYDELVLATGAVWQSRGIPGVEEFAMPLGDLKDALAIHQRLEAKRGTAIVCGGGATGIELACDIKVMEPARKVQLVDAGDRILPDYPDHLRQKAVKRLRKLGIELIMGRRIRHLTKDRVHLSDGKELNGDAILWCAGMAPSPLAETDHPVHYLGDAHRVGNVPQALAEADNLARHFRGKGGRETKASKVRLLSLGPGHGIATGPIPMTGWLAALLKFLVEWFHVFSQLGLSPAITYFQSHLSQPGHDKTLFGDLLSSRGQRLWLFPLRLFLGWLWLMEGLKKVAGDTLWRTARTPWDLLALGPDSWLRPDQLHLPFPWLIGPDAVTSASIQATAQELSQAMPGWMEFILRTIMPQPNVAVFCQQLLVGLELAIGLGLILGLFTWLSSLASFGLMTGLFLLGLISGQALWVLPASLALMAGAGRFLGLDALVMPRLRRSLGLPGGQADLDLL